jgi:hypothetical protein
MFLERSTYARGLPLITPNYRRHIPIANTQIRSMLYSLFLSMTLLICMEFNSDLKQDIAALEFVEAVDSYGEDFLTAGNDSSIIEQVDETCIGSFGRTAVEDTICVNLMTPV